MTNLHDRATKIVVGWREYISLPEWNVMRIKAKTDTGARTSAIDVADVQELPGDRVRFTLVYDRKSPDHRTDVETDIVRRTKVKSSFGAAHDRLIVRTRMKLGPIEKDVDLSLVSRKNMLCRMLLGRIALEDDFIVDPARTYMHGRGRKKKSKA